MKKLIFLFGFIFLCGIVNAQNYTCFNSSKYTIETYAPDKSGNMICIGIKKETHNTCFYLNTTREEFFSSGNSFTKTKEYVKSRNIRVNNYGEGVEFTYEDLTTATLFRRGNMATIIIIKGTENGVVLVYTYTCNEIYQANVTFS
ncbi:hypothetical protein [uncultured Alistipes sp.]|uniref:hypothetical protein n=1 Tax=uncultured Alistipes sp. TaxID=538949 RepID=UPI0032083CC1